MKKGYQEGYAALHREAQYDIESRAIKGKKIICVLQDYYKGDISTLNLLDIGCSTGIITHTLSKYVRWIVGIDIDLDAVIYAEKMKENENCHFMKGDSMDIPFKNCSFDVVICNHIYEHVPDSQKLMNEIRRILKSEGICYFAMTNRLCIIEPHYKLPFLSFFPKKIANSYLHFFRGHKRYYEELYTCFGLRKLTKDFEVIDYTCKIAEDPKSFAADDMIFPGSIKQKGIIFFCRLLYWLFPTYIWLLIKTKK